MKKIKNPLKEWREKTGFTRAEAAAVLQFNYSYYCQIESGTQPPTSNLLNALIKAGKECEVCPEVDKADFLAKWALYVSARYKELLTRKPDESNV